MKRTFADIRPVRKHRKVEPIQLKKKSRVAGSRFTGEDWSLKLRPKLNLGFLKNWKAKVKAIIPKRNAVPKILRRVPYGALRRRERKHFFKAWGIRQKSITEERLKKIAELRQQKLKKKPLKKRSHFFQKLRHQSLDFWAGVKNLSQEERIGFHKKKVQKRWYQRWWFNFIVIGFFLGLAIIMTYPLIKWFTNGIPGDNGDGGLFLWDSWWVKHALLDLHQSPFYTDLIAFPHRVDLTFHTLALFNSLVSIPLQLIFGIVPAFNIIFLAGFVLTGWGTYLLIRYLTKSTLGGLIGGVMLAFAPYVMVRSLGHFNLSTIWPIPFFLYFLMKMLYGRGWHNAILAGLFVGILCLNELQYAVMIALFGLLIYIVYLIAEFKRVFLSTFLIKTVIMVLVALIVFSPLLIPALKNYQANRLEKIELGRYKIYSADLVRFVIPSHLSTFFGDYANKVKTVIPGGGTEGTVFFGYTVLALLIIAIIFAFVMFQLRKHRKLKEDDSKMRIWSWIVPAIVFFVFSLGPILYVAGQDSFQVSNLKFRIALPFIVIYQLPFIGDLRAPSRFSIFTMVCLVIIAGIALARIFHLVYRIKWRWLKYPLIGIIFLLFLSAVFGEFLSIPFPINNATVPKIYAQIRKDSNDCTILDLPCGFSSGYYGFGHYHSIMQSYQREHGKKLISFSISRFPQWKAGMYLKMPGLAYLIDYKRPVSVAEDFDRRKIQQSLRALNLRYVVLHKKYFNPIIQEKLKLYLTKVVGLDQFYEDQDTIGFIFNREYLPQVE